MKSNTVRNETNFTIYRDFPRLFGGRTSRGLGEKKFNFHLASAHAYDEKSQFDPNP